MLISRTHKFAFLHNPKVAGTSVRQALSQYHDYPQTFWHQGLYNGRVVDLAHIPYTQLKFEDQLAIESQDFIFGFVRDPIDRFWSGLYEFRRQHADWAVARLPTEDLILSVLNPGVLSQDWRFVHLFPQWEFFPLDEDGKIPGSVHIYLHDSFEAAWHTITQRLHDLGTGIPATIPLGNSRHRVHGTPTELSEAAQEKLHSLYARDFQLFGYAAWKFSSKLPVEERYSTHWRRIEAIHSNTRPVGIEPYLTAGEEIAFKEKWVPSGPRNPNEI